MENTVKILRTFLSVTEADCARSLLETAGIRCEIRQSEAAAIAMGSGSLALEVRDEDFDAAKELLCQSATQSGPFDDAPVADSVHLSQRVAQAPIVLYVVAAVFILQGCYGVYRLFAETTPGISIPLDVLGIFIGIGLLSRRGSWRTCGLIFAWFCIALCLAFMTFLVFKGGAPSKAILLVGASTLIWAWSVFVLNRRDVKTAFGLN